MDKLLQIFRAANSVLSSKRYLFLFTFFSVAVFWGLLLAPGQITSSNIESQGFTNGDYVVLGTIAIIASLIIVMQIFSFRLTGKAGAGQSALSGAGFFSALTSAIFSSATCGLCVSALFGFLGTGTIIFLVDNQTYVILGSFGLLLFSLYFSSKKVNNDCDTCHV